MITLAKGWGLWAILCVQALCAVFFLADGVVDVLGYPDSSSFKVADRFEYLIAIALAVGLLLTTIEIRRLLRRQARLGDQLKIASGALAEILEQHFDEWGLTQSERDVALLAIKGLSISEIADLRQTKGGTTKAQLAAVYRKAGVSGRPQLMSLFIEELMAEKLTDGAG